MATDAVQEVSEALQWHADEIAKRFKDPKITIVVRAPALEDGDLVFTEDDLGLVIAAIRKLQARDGD